MQGTATSLRKGKRIAFRIIAIYATVGVVWVLLIHHLLPLAVGSNSTLSVLQTLGDWLFILTTAAVLFFFISRYFEKSMRVAKTLSDSSEMYMALVRASPNAVTVGDLEGNIIEVSQRSVEIHGAESPDELLGKNAIELIAPEDHERAIENTIKTLEQGSVSNIEYTMLRKDGSRFIGELSASLIRDAEGEPAAFIATVRDVTERREMDEALKSSEEKFRLISEQSAMGIGILQDNELKYSNRSAYELIGYDLEEVMNWGLAEIAKVIHPDDLSFIARRFEDRQSGEVDDLANYSYRIITKSGKIRWLDQYINDIIFEGRPATLLTVLDITDLKEAEEALRASEERWRSLVQNVPDIITVVDGDGTIKAINHTASGIPPEEVIGKKFYEFLSPKDIEKARKSIKSVFTKGEAEVYEVLAIGPKGPETAIYESRAVPVKHDGKVVAATVVIRDITEQRRDKEELRKSEEKWRLLVQNLPDIILTIGRDGTIQDMNRTVTGASLDQTIGHKVSEFLGQEGLAKTNQMLAKVFDEGETDIMEILGLGPGGPDTAWYEARAVPVVYDGRVVAATVIGRDITERKVSEQTLKASEEKYRLLLENAGMSIVYHDLEGKILLINNVGANNLGGTIEEFTGKTMHEIMGSEVGRNIAERAHRIAETGEGADFEDYFELPTQSMWFWSNLQPVRDSSGTITGVQVISHDITERKKAEEALKAAEQEKTTIMNSVSEHIVYQDLDHKIIWLNRVAGESVGKEPGQLIGLHCYEVWHQLSEPCERCPVGKAVETGRTEENEITTPDQRVWIVRGYPVFDDNGKVERVVEVTQEITERKRTEEALAQEKERLAVTLRSIGDGVIATDTNGEILFINNVAEVLTGWFSEEAAGRPLSEVFRIVNEKTREPADDPVQKVLKEGHIVGLPVQMLLVAKDGTERVIADSGAPIRDRDSRIIGVILVFRDITEKRKIEEELAKSDKLESLGILAGGIAHDFNNILTALLGNISIARRSPHNEEMLTERLLEAEKACMRARDLTQQLLTFSRGGVPVKTTASLDQLLKETADFVLRGSNVRCEFVFADGLWPAKVDVGQINQVIQNLIINADQAMPKGGDILIEASNLDVGENNQGAMPLPPGPYVKLVIQDHGIGIPDEHITKIFDPFFSTKQKGSGLGLATSYSIIIRHGGYITVDSKLGEGTAFNIYLPASPQESPREPREERKPVVGKGRVLVMDDEEAIREMLGIMLDDLGYKAEFAGSGEDAVEIFRQAKDSGKPFDMVILDLTVPGKMGGKESIKELKKIDPEIKAVVSSGYSTDPVMADYMNYGFNGVIAKPYDDEILSKVLNSVLAEGDE